MFSDVSPVFAAAFPVVIAGTLLGVVVMLGHDAARRERKQRAVKAGASPMVSTRDDGLPTFHFVAGNDPVAQPTPTPADAAKASAAPVGAKAAKRKPASAFGEEFFHATRQGVGAKRTDDRFGQGASAKRSAERAAAAMERPKVKLTRGALEAHRANRAKLDGQR